MIGTKLVLHARRAGDMMAAAEPRLRVPVGLLIAAMLLAAAGARAQEVPAPPLPATAAIPAHPAPVANNRGIIMPVEKSGDVQTHWSARRDYLRDRDERRAED